MVPVNALFCAKLIWESKNVIVSKAAVHYWVNRKTSVQTPSWIRCLRRNLSWKRVEGHISNKMGGGQYWLFEKMYQAAQIITNKRLSRNPFKAEGSRVPESWLWETSKNDRGWISLNKLLNAPVNPACDKESLVTVIGDIHATRELRETQALSIASSVHGW